MCVYILSSQTQRPADGVSELGSVVPHGFYRSYVCPRWVHSLQQAELYGVYGALKAAVGCRLRSVAVGIDNEAVRVQSASLRASTDCPVQLRLLRRIFWLRAWSGLQLSFFSSAFSGEPR